MDSPTWDRITRSQLTGFTAGTAVLFLLMLWSESGFVVVLDHANLLFHEAGHVFVGMLFARLEPYGGTVGQLFFPLVLALSFWRRNQPLSFAVSLLWFFENWPNIARYMADARAQLLPLVGGGEHDWHLIFSRWNLLAYDLRIANGVKAAGWIAMLSVCAWVALQFWRQDRRPLESSVEVI